MMILLVYLSIIYSTCFLIYLCTYYTSFIIIIIIIVCLVKYILITNPISGILMRNCRNSFNHNVMFRRTKQSFEHLTLELY